MYFFVAALSEGVGVCGRAWARSPRRGTCLGSCTCCSSAFASTPCLFCPLIFNLQCPSLEHASPTSHTLQHRSLVSSASPPDHGAPLTCDRCTHSIKAELCHLVGFQISPFLLLQGCKDPASPRSPLRLAPLSTPCGLGPRRVLDPLGKPARPARARDGVERAHPPRNIPAQSASQGTALSGDRVTAIMFPTAVAHQRPQSVVL